MKYRVGDIFIIKNYQSKPRLGIVEAVLLPKPNIDSYVIVTQAENHNETWEEDSTESDNTYIVLSQVDKQVYLMFEDDLDQCERI